jgi:endo-1,4-beta-xylanase
VRPGRHSGTALSVAAGIRQYFRNFETSCSWTPDWGALYDTKAAVAAGSLLPAGQAGAASTGLKTLAEAEGIYFGTVLTQSDLSNSTLTAVAGSQLDMVTSGNEMKRDTTEPANGAYNFSPGDQIVSSRRPTACGCAVTTWSGTGQLPSWACPPAGCRPPWGPLTTEATHDKGKVYL